MATLDIYIYIYKDPGGYVHGNTGYIYIYKDPGGYVHGNTGYIYIYKDPGGYVHGNTGYIYIYIYIKILVALSMATLDTYIYNFENFLNKYIN